MINSSSLSSRNPLEAHPQQVEQAPENHSQEEIVQTTCPSPETRHIKESALDHFMQIVGNPVKTITNIPGYIQSVFEKQELLKKLKNERDLFYMVQSEASSRRGLEQEFNAVLEAYNNAFDSYLAPGTQEAIEHCTSTYAAALNHAINESLKSERLQEVKQKKAFHFRKKIAYLHSGLRDHFENFMSACDAILSTEVFDKESYNLFTSTEKALSNAYHVEIARRREALESRNHQPGAFHISADEAAAQGIHFTSDAPRPESTGIPEATILPTTSGTLLDSKKEKKLVALQKKVRAVEAETPMMSVHGIPVAEATVVDSTES